MQVRRRDARVAAHAVIVMQVRRMQQSCSSIAMQVRRRNARVAAHAGIVVQVQRRNTRFPILT